MATRGIVAIATNEGWKGRYVHWDNYPERIVGVLAELVQRDGIEKVRQTLIADNPSWSIIEPLAKPSKAGEPSLYEQHKCVTGYGYVHTDIDDPDGYYYTQDDTELAWADWLYVIHDDGLEVRRVERNEQGHDVPVYADYHPWAFISPNGVTA